MINLVSTGRTVMRLPFRMVFGTCLAFGLLGLAGCASGPKCPPASLPPVVESLRNGGHVIYMRHTNADVGRDVPGDGEWWKKCGEGHRMLSERGRAEAVQIGRAIHRLGIPISEVRSSEYCRAVETARLLALGDPKTDARLNGWPAWKAVDPEHGLERLVEGTRSLLAIRSAHGNVMLVSHKQDFPHPAAPVLTNLEDAESAVFTPDGKGGFVLRGRVKPEDWKALSSSLTNLF
jgi:phosphohistidine phosphatase SixA